MPDAIQVSMLATYSTAYVGGGRMSGLTIHR